MKFNKILLISSVIGAMGLSSVANAATLSDSATVNFTGIFQDTTCKVDLNNTTVSGAGTVDVNLGIYKTTVITTDNDATTPIPFSVDFSDCGAITKASIVFAGTQTQAGLFDVSGGNQSNVGVGINTSSTAGSYLTTGDQTPVTITDGSGTTSFFARYVKIGATALVEGQTNAVATMDITYS